MESYFTPKDYQEWLEKLERSKFQPKKLITRTIEKDQFGFYLGMTINQVLENVSLITKGKSIAPEIQYSTNKNGITTTTYVYSKHHNGNYFTFLDGKLITIKIRGIDKFLHWFNTDKANIIYSIK